MAKKPEERRSVARNRKARHEFHILEELECGIVLVGTEVKSLRARECSLQEAYVRIRDGELWLMRCHIPEYSHGNSLNHETRRDRKLLAHKREIERLGKAAKEKGVTLIPLEVFFDKSKVKVQVALVRGKKQHDKRASLKEQSDKRDMARALGRRR